MLLVFQDAASGRVKTPDAEYKKAMKALCDLSTTSESRRLV